MAIDAPQCSRHGESTRLSCATCAEPVCPKCGVRTGVGLKCEECARPTAPAAPAALRRPRRARWPAALAALGVVIIAVALGVVLAGGSGSTPIERQAAVGRWTALPNVPGIRGTTTAVVLRDGSVLVAGGGVGAVPLAAAQIYHPDTGRWSTIGSLQQARRGHAAVRLADGRVLVTGGIAGDDVLASAEIYDPATGQWTRTGSMTVARLGLTLTTLRDGTVLATGGTSGSGRGVQPLAIAEIYDPATGTWTSTGSMTASRFDHTATLLPDGRVLLAGGLGASGAPQASTEIYDPAADAFIYAGRMRNARSNHAASLLRSGAVLVAGGGGPDGNATITSAEIFRPDEDGWSAVAPLSRSREGASATTLADGRVLVAGGQTVQRGVRTSLAGAEVFEPESGTWRPAGTMQCPRSEHVAVRLPGGGVLVLAGDAVFPGQAPVASNCAELYRP